VSERDVLTYDFEAADFAGAEDYALEVIAAHRRQIDGIREWLIVRGYNDLDAESIISAAASPADTTEAG